MALPLDSRVKVSERLARRARTTSLAKAVGVPEAALGSSAVATANIGSYAVHFLFHARAVANSSRNGV
jgi:hypothetical protein